MQKVLHLLTSNSFSGAENVACQIINMFADDNEFEMFYCSPDGQIREILYERNIKYIPVEKFNLKNIKKVINSLNPDLIHAHDMKASVIASLCSNKIKIISHIHNNSFESRKISLKSLIYIYAGMKADSIIWVSKSSYNGYMFHKLFEHKSTILYNIIDTNYLIKKAIDNSKTKYNYDIIFLGRLSYPKDPLRLIKILGELKKMNNNIKIAIVGTGELESRVIEESKKNQVYSNITFFGYKNNPYNILNNSKLMIMTSRWEGTPMSALEALAFGKPVISSPTDGLIDIIINGYNGFLCKNDDEFVSNINNLLRDKKSLHKMSDNSKKWSEKFNDINSYKKKIKELYFR